MVVTHILDLDSRGFAPTLGAVRDMADKLLAARGAGPVGQEWPKNFVNGTPSLTPRFNRPYDRQRALCEDPGLIISWFDLVQRTKATYGICDEDVFNLDEASFMMGKITTQLVVIGLENSFVQLILPMATLSKGAFGKLFEFLSGNLDFIN